MVIKAIITIELIDENNNTTFKTSEEYGVGKKVYTKYPSQRSIVKLLQDGLDKANGVK